MSLSVVNGNVEWRNGDTLVISSVSMDIMIADMVWYQVYVSRYVLVYYVLKQLYDCFSLFIALLTQHIFQLLGLNFLTILLLL